MTDAIEHSAIGSPRRDACGPAIKPLDWKGVRGGPGSDIRAEPSDFLRYTVRHLREGIFDVTLHTDTGSIWFKDRSVIPAEHGSYDEAVSFAEDDYRGRVEAHLTSTDKAAFTADREFLARAVDAHAWSRYDTIVGFFERNVGANDYQETYAIMYRADVRTAEQAKAWLLQDDTRIGDGLRESLAAADQVIAAISKGSDR